MQTVEARLLQPLLCFLSEEGVKELGQKAVVRRIKKGHVFFHKGDPADGLYGLIAGSIAVSTESCAGAVRSLGLVPPGQVFGEMAALDGGVWTATAVAREGSTVVFVACRDLQAMLMARPELGVHVIRQLCGHLRWNRDRFEDLVFLDFPARLAKLVLGLQHYHALPDEKLKCSSLRFAQRELAEMLGLSREWVSQELIKWRDAGIVDLRRNRIAVLDRAALARIAAATRD